MNSKIETRVQMYIVQIKVSMTFYKNRTNVRFFGNETPFPQVTNRMLFHTSQCKFKTRKHKQFLFGFFHLLLILKLHSTKNFFGQSHGQINVSRSLFFKHFFHRFFCCFILSQHS
jgi:hypothetical protein